MSLRDDPEAAAAWLAELIGLAEQELPGPGNGGQRHAWCAREVIERLRLAPEAADAVVRTAYSFVRLRGAERGIPIPHQG